MSYAPGFFDAYYRFQVRTLMENAGLTGVQNQGTAYIRDGTGSETQEHLLSRPLLVKAGQCSEKDRATIEAGLLGPDFRFVGHTIFSAWGRRPDRGPKLFEPPVRKAGWPRTAVPIK